MYFFFKIFLFPFLVVAIVDFHKEEKQFRQKSKFFCCSKISILSRLVSCFLGLYTNLDKMLIFGLCFVLLFKKFSVRNGIQKSSELSFSMLIICIIFCNFYLRSFLDHFCLFVFLLPHQILLKRQFFARNFQISFQIYLFTYLFVFYFIFYFSKYFFWIYCDYYPISINRFSFIKTNLFFQFRFSYIKNFPNIIKQINYFKHFRLY